MAYSHQFVIGNLSQMTTVASLETFLGLDKQNLRGKEFTVVELGVKKNGQPLGIAFVTVHVSMKKHMLGFNKQVLDGHIITVKFLSSHQYFLKCKQWVMRQDGVISSKSLKPKCLSKYSPLRSKFYLCDFGANLLHRSMLKDIENIKAMGYDYGVSCMVVPGYNIAQSEQALKLSKENSEGLYYTAGIHPHFVDMYTSDSIAVIRNMVMENCIAVGPTGMDFTKDSSLSNKKKQQEVFEAQVKLACEIGNKPIYVYERGAHLEVLTILTKNRDKLAGILIHDFSGTPKQAEAYVKIGCYIGVTGGSVLLQKKRGKTFSEFRAKVPLEQILLESRGLPTLIHKPQVDHPRAIRTCKDSKRNETHPVSIVEISVHLAQSFNISVEEVTRKISAASMIFIRDLSKSKPCTSKSKAKIWKGTYFDILYTFGFLLFVWLCCFIGFQQLLHLQSFLEENHPGMYKYVAFWKFYATSGQ
ncbi:hypothetical protein CHS0354_022225 [Potamilus streckersoni]|uniref:Uncharacterized protein n=1 Tax=Potamilus streckersoni TaxID=2493646 RepID=A0AAE0T2C2_9BIVA|nr:hypothetical protein CHS0354_022225 [Potamilus streckersoni]